MSKWGDENLGLFFSVILITLNVISKFLISMIYKTVVIYFIQNNQSKIMILRKSINIYKFVGRILMIYEIIIKWKHENK